MTTTREKGRRGDEKACLGRNEFAGVERWDELGLRLGGDGARHPSSRGYIPSKRGKTRPTPDVWRGPKLHVCNWFDETHELTAVHLLIFLLHFQPPPQTFAQQVLNRCLFFPVNHQKAKKKKRPNGAATASAVIRGELGGRRTLEGPRQRGRLTVTS